MKRSDFDFERAKGLMDTIVSAGQHGPIYQKIAGWAGEELKAMMEEVEPAVARQPQSVTPAAGPANGLVYGEDGKLRQVEPTRQSDVVLDTSPRTGPVPADNVRVLEGDPDRPYHRPVEGTSLLDEPLVPTDPIERRTL